MTEITVSDSLVKLDNLIDAVNYILEELQTRKASLMSQEKIKESIIEVFDEDLKDDVIYEIRKRFGNGICREVAFYVMERIDSDIEAFINSRVNEAINNSLNQNQ